MFLTQAENDKLTQVGRGTPGGELLRRYWQPVAGIHEVSEESPTKMVRLLGEDLVLFRDKSGRVGLLADHCAHRGASLCYGRVEERGISCAYHGWLYDVDGNCLETPAEPSDSLFRLTVHQTAYPVQKLCGLYWAYLGPSPVPPIRRLDLMSYPIEHIMEMTFDANWVQVVENNLDGSHIYILHQTTLGARRDGIESTTRGLIEDLVTLDYEEVPLGIMRRMVTTNGYLEEDPFIFPNMLRRMTEVSIKVPIDDQHTRKFVIFVELDRATLPRDEDDYDYYVFLPEEGKSAAGQVHPQATYRMDKLRFQDIMAIETQGLTSARENWHPATRDRGVALLDRMLLREMDRVAAGHDPLGVVRDPALEIDTNFAALHKIGAHVPVPQGILTHQRRRTAVVV